MSAAEGESLRSDLRWVHARETRVVADWKADARLS